ncbi:MAG: SpoIID/LytB domain-containing protein [Deltaproteobacteria bacterium]|nr:MAG: SpoIID/LytB domain-containing protein [Deltaproteobacteria bacterium]
MSIPVAYPASRSKEGRRQGEISVASTQRTFRSHSRILLDVVLLGFLFLAMLLPGFMDYENTAEIHRMIEEGRYLEAIVRLRERRRIFDAPAYQVESGKMIANIFSVHLHDYTAAEKELARALRYTEDPEERAELYFLRGMARLEGEDLAGALSLFRELALLFPESDERSKAELMIHYLERRLLPRDREESAADGEPLLVEKEKPAPARKRALEIVKVPEKTRWIRVLLEEDARRIVVSAPGGVAIRHRGSRKIVATSLEPLVIRAHGGKISLTGIETARTLILTPLRGFLSLDGRPYRGAFRIDRSDGGLRVINIVSLEDYLKGVVPEEIPATWNLEALKAQAVAARTYALYEMERRKHYAYHVRDTVDSQVYGGYAEEQRMTNRAVEETRGEILSYGGKPIIAYFHANSGGMTASARYVWGKEFPYLQAKRDPYSEGTPVSHWEVVYQEPQLRHELQGAGYTLGRIEGITLRRRSPSGRYRTVEIHHTLGTLRLTSVEFRRALGAQRFKSNYFRVYRKGNLFVFSGKGFGHGVGMSQWGAGRMARLGKSYREILHFYYEGATLDNMM